MPFSNPFGRDEEGVPRNIIAYKVLTVAAWLLQFITCAFYTSSVPGTVWTHRATPFTISHIFVSIFWVALWIAQIIYVWHLFSGDVGRNNAAASAGSYFILFNVLHWVWVMLWTHNMYIIAEVVVILNFFQLTALYFRNHATAPRFIHVSVAALPLTWTFFTIYWNGAVMIHCHGLICRVLANVAIWGFLVYAGFFLLAFNDYTVGFATSFLMAGLGVQQFFTKVVALQWPFAFTIMGVTFLASLAHMGGFVPTASSRGDPARSGERAPLLQDA